MEDYPSNSKNKPSKKREEPKKNMEPIVQEGRAIQRKKPLGRRFAETFGGGDARGVGSYVIIDVLIPAAKDAISDAVSQGIERMLFGDSRPRTRSGHSRPSGNSGYTPYNRYGSSSLREEPRDRSASAASRRGRNSYDIGDVIVETRAQAEEVINRLYDGIAEYGEVSVSDLYSLVNITPVFTDEKWGWTRLDGARSHRARGGGFLIELPRPEPID